MAGSLTDYLELALLEELVGKAAFVMPTAYIALSRADPGEAGVGVDEPTIGSLGYARIATAAANWGAAAAGQIANAQILSFAEATGSWGACTHWIAYDAATAGNPLFYGDLTVPKTITSGDTVSFPVGDLYITLT